MRWCADLTAAVAHLLEPDARSRLLLEHGVRIGKTKLDDPSAPFYGAAAAEALAEFQPESDWQGLAEQARKTLQEAPRPSDQGSIETLTPTQRAYLAATIEGLGARPARQRRAQPHAAGSQAPNASCVVSTEAA